MQNWRVPVCDRSHVRDSLNEGAFTVDPGWQITAFNKATERITGVPREHQPSRGLRRQYHGRVGGREEVMKPEDQGAA
jgi:PAS domain-containing protein